MAAVGCGRLGFELLPHQAGGSGGSGGGSGTGPDSGAPEQDSAAPDLDASDAADSAAPDANILDDAAANDATLPDATLPDAAIDTCGSGTLVAPEQCDDGAESVSCDADCTFAVCGDGLLNTSAGESCDDGAAPASCGVACQPQTCRAGCSCEWYRGVRYMLCAEQLAWDPAEVACETESMRLVRIDSTTEQTWLRFRTLQEGFAKFHLGATDVATEGTWLWADGSAFWQGVANGTPIGGAFTVWATGEPNSFYPDENCSEVQSLCGWNDCVCDLAKPVVCKAYRAPLPGCGNGVVEAGEACDDGVASATCDADCSAAVCGDGVVNSARGEACDDAKTGDYCSSDCSAFACPVGYACFTLGAETFAVSSVPVSFRDAAVECGRAGMTLARVGNAAVNGELRGHANQAGIGNLWIGAFDLDQANEWLWSDLTPLWSGTAGGTAHAYGNFTTGAPSGMTNRDCLTMLPNGEWQDADCAATTGFACQRL